MQATVSTLPTCCDSCDKITVEPTPRMGTAPMRHSQHTEHEILFLLDEADAGISIAEICSTAGISLRTFYRWRNRYGGLTSPALRHLKELEIENQRLRRMVDKLSEQRRSTAPAPMV